MNKLIALTIGCLALPVLAVAQQNPDKNDCPAVGSISEQHVSASSVYYNFTADNKEGETFKSFCEISGQCGRNKSFRYQYDYTDALLNPSLTRFVPVSNTLVCVYDMKNTFGHEFHVPLAARYSN